MPISFKHFKQISARHITAISVIALGAVVDFGVFTFLIRLTPTAEPLAVVLAIVIAACFNYLLLGFMLKSKKDKAKGLFVYLVSLLLLLAVRATIMKIVVIDGAPREVIYFIAMVVSFSINWIVLTLLLGLNQIDTIIPEEEANNARQ